MAYRFEARHGDWLSPEHNEAATQSSRKHEGDHLSLELKQLALFAVGLVVFAARRNRPTQIRIIAARL